jgi:hypothetical protein
MWINLIQNIQNFSLLSKFKLINYNIYVRVWSGNDGVSELTR